MPGKQKILIIEDDRNVIHLLQLCLESSFEIVARQRGRDGLIYLELEQVALVVLDIRLPDMDGFAICREIRKNSSVPILMLSSFQEDIDKIVGLEVGGDDYLGKPFNPLELKARIRALLRRPRKTSSLPVPKVEVAESVTIDTKAHTVNIHGTTVDFTPIEFRVLECLLTKPNQVLGRQDILDAVWGSHYVGNDRVVDAHIKNLRSRLAPFGLKESIISVRGRGYKWKS